MEQKEFRFIDRIRYAFGSEDTRCEIASMANLPEDMLHRMANDRNGSVRAAIAKRKDLPKDVVRTLANDRYDVVRDAIMKEPFYERQFVKDMKISDYPSRFKDDISSDVENRRELPFIGDFKKALYDNLRAAHIDNVNESTLNKRFIRKGPVLSQDLIDKKMLRILDYYESDPIVKNSVSAIKKRFLITGEKEERKIFKRIPLANRLRKLMSDSLSSLKENTLQPITIKDIEDVCSQVDEPVKVSVTGWRKEDEDFIIKQVNDCTEHLKAGILHASLPLEDKAFRYNETIEFLLGDLSDSYNFFKNKAYNNFSKQLEDVIENPEAYTEDLFSFAKNRLEFIHNVRINMAQENLEDLAKSAYWHGCPSDKMYQEAAKMAKPKTLEEAEGLRRFKEAHNLNGTGVKKPIGTDTSQVKREAVISTTSESMNIQKLPDGKLSVNRKADDPLIVDGISVEQEGFHVVKKDDKFNYLSKDGNLLCKSWLDKAQPFENGIAKCSIGNSFFEINKEGIVLKKETLMEETKAKGIKI